VMGDGKSAAKILMLECLTPTHPSFIDFGYMSEWASAWRYQTWTANSSSNLNTHRAGCNEGL
jgi:hypothetical protein